MGTKGIKKTGLFVATLLFMAFFSLTIFISCVEAKTNSFVSIVNPVRGRDFWESNESPVAPVREQKELIEQKGLTATWLLRPDILVDADLSKEFENGYEDSELGIFFEITPAFASWSGIEYSAGEKSDSNRFFLSGYSLDERKKLIDSAFRLFQEKYGYYPKSVGAWHIDAFSAEYMSQNYDVEAVMLVADQYSTDRYRVWGAWWGVPYYPSSKHILVPARGVSEKLDVVVTQWAVRDPVNGYGPGKESLYSVQPNDYVVLGLGIEYFQKLLDIYLNPKDAEDFGHITVGIENELFSGTRVGYAEQLDEVSQRQVAGDLDVVTMVEFAKWYKKTYPNLSKNKTLEAKDPLGSDKKAEWIMNEKNRVFLLHNKSAVIKDLRLYEQTNPEPFLVAPNYYQELRVETKAAVDTVKDPESAVDVTGKDLEGIVKSYSEGKDRNLLPVLGFVLLVIAVFTVLRNKLSEIRRKKAKWILIFTGTLAWSLTMIKSGLLYDFGMGFWGPNGHDGVWHLSVINSLADGSLSMPVFSGEQLQNYHIGYDLLLAALHKLTGIPARYFYFQIIPPLVAFLTGFLVYKFVKKWKNSDAQAFWATFFVYFGGSVGWIVTLIRSGEIGGESMFWSQQSLSTLVNPPFAASLVIMLLGFISLAKYLKKKSVSWMIVSSILFGVLIQIKVYAGLLSLGALLMGALYQFVKNKEKVLFKVFGISLAISLVLFFPLNKGSAGLVVFRPGWFLETMMGLEDRLGWQRFYSAMTNYRLGGQIIKMVAAYLVALAIFWYGNMGLRALQDIRLIKKIRGRDFDAFDVMFYSIIFAGFLMPMLFLQEGTPWNTIQFFYYSLIFAGVFAGITVGEYLEKVKSSLKKFTIGFLIFVVALLSAFSTLRHYVPRTPPARVSYEELEALEFLSNQKEGVVLTYPFDKIKARELASKPPRPLYRYESTAYVAAFSEQDVFLEDEVNLNITGFDWKKRREEVESFLQEDDEEAAQSFLTRNNISYIYWVRDQRALLGDKQLGLEKIFENPEITIYKVKKG